MITIVDIEAVVVYCKQKGGDVLLLNMEGIEVDLFLRVLQSISPHGLKAVAVKPEEYIHSNT